ncbi:MAG TPA: isoleucine--tRNA ligase [Candidatus Baltobacteraceae bacterium]|nr:isoleucine--tRNA ligase [Candidatus Baltobacteraceae bacterium]
MSETVERDYRDTLRLPKTAFPMKADLPKREPDRLAWWNAQRVYERRLEANRKNGPWILHDGPPYANGELHMGHFLNMVLKDMFVKIALLDGKWADFIPGWDMHGLPIELETLKFLGIKDFHAIDPLELRERCKERALFWLGRQSEARQRMGVFGHFDRPYRTIDPSFEATIVNALADLAERKQLYKGLRSTLWCVHDETALAEAEIEYEPKISPSIYVRFSAGDEQREAILSVFAASRHPEVLAEGEPRRTSVLIWTTTPWTLPANVAIALRADATYGLYRVDDELLILASALAPKALGEAFARAELLASVAGDRLDDLRVRHPFMDRDSVIVLADYVDLETGTGAVHTAPGHGADDFDTGVKYDLPILNPVDASGHFTQEAGPYAGLFIFKANKVIVEDLRASGALWRVEEYEHSYPHCWRCHNPVIFRATAQWFIAMDQNRLRARAIEAVDRVDYVPEWGRARQRQMIEKHPEWCLSRQRIWGTPIPALLCAACGESMLDPHVARNVAKRFAEAGAGSWWVDPVEMYLPAGFHCPNCRGTTFEKEMNIVDIWFESGVTHLAVLGHDDIPWPCEMYLEGGDQFRGWFRSSLLTGVAIKGDAPYKRVVKNGWVNDEQGRAMSKSRGTGLDAVEAMNRWGADVLRLWSASVEFVDDVRFGPNVIEQVGRVYRNIRNRIRFMLSNLDDLGAHDVVAREEMEPLDRLACAITDTFVAEVKALYETFAIHDAYLRVVEFESAMSSFYFDALKDPLYSLGENSRRRRSAQSALLYALKRLLTAVAPILSFTAEEAWQEVPERLRGDERSVFDSAFGAPATAPPRERELWEMLRELRARVAASESPRDFEARVELRVPAARFGELSALGDNLREALVVSQLDLRESPGEETGLTIHPAYGEKCRRCWKFRELGTDPEHPSICADCAAVVRAL